MTVKTYRIAHITDILSIPVEHWDEAFDDLRMGLASVSLIYAILCEQGPMPPIAEMCGHIDFTPDGKREVKSTLNGRHLMTMSITKEEQP
jgi:hypothetical protein